MKKLVVAGIVCSFFLSLMGCSKNETSNGLNEVIKAGGYDSEEAIKKGDVVSTALGDYNLETFQEFLTNFSNKKEDTVRITGYTHEGDPIFQDLRFDGEVIHYSYDNSHDQYGVPENVEDVCKAILTEEAADNRVDFVISDCSTIDDHYLIQVRKSQITYD